MGTGLLSGEHSHTSDDKNNSHINAFIITGKCERFPDK